jgi:predicted ester cyclase
MHGCTVADGGEEAWGQEATMSVEENKDVVRRYLEEIINRADYAVPEEIIAPNYVNHTAGGGIGSGRANFVQGLRALNVAFPDWHVTIEEMIGEGDVVVDRFAIRATHSGSANGIAATGRRIETLGMHMWRVMEGKLVEGWYVTDALPQVIAALGPAPTSP